MCQLATALYHDYSLFRARIAFRVTRKKYFIIYVASMIASAAALLKCCPSFCIDCRGAATWCAEELCICVQRYVGILLVLGTSCGVRICITSFCVTRTSICISLCFVDDMLSRFPAVYVASVQPYKVSSPRTLPIEFNHLFCERCNRAIPFVYSCCSKSNTKNRCNMLRVAGNATKRWNYCIFSTQCLWTTFVLGQSIPKDNESLIPAVEKLPRVFLRDVNAIKHARSGSSLHAVEPSPVALVRGSVSQATQKALGGVGSNHLAYGAPKAMSYVTAFSFDSSVPVLSAYRHREEK